MMASDSAGLLADFEAGRVDPAHFPHGAHVRVSYELLERHPFPEALLHLARAAARAAAEQVLRRLGGFRGAQSGSFPQSVAGENLRPGATAVEFSPSDVRLATGRTPMVDAPVRGARAGEVS